ncbi:FecR domain-containing protein, partial [Acinetobacter baumannii]
MSAAAVFILAIAGIYYFKYSNGDQNIQTTYGQITEKILPDGSSVLLNANSSIRTSSFHSGNTREVWLQGEAYFKVHKT